jgi:ketosteroid isomerase-like protein
VTAHDVETVKGAYAALNAGDAPAALGILDENAEWHEHSELPEAGTYQGRAKIEAFLASFLDSWDEFIQEIEGVDEANDKVAVHLHMRGQGKGSGIDVETRYVHIWTMRDGRGVRVDAYYDPNQARQALEESRTRAKLSS